MKLFLALLFSQVFYAPYQEPTDPPKRVTLVYVPSKEMPYSHFKQWARGVRSLTLKTRVTVIRADFDGETPLALCKKLFRDKRYRRLARTEWAVNFVRGTRETTSLQTATCVKTVPCSFLKTEKLLGISDAGSVTLPGWTKREDYCGE